MAAETCTEAPPRGPRSRPCSLFTTEATGQKPEERGLGARTACSALGGLPLNPAARRGPRQEPRVPPRPGFCSGTHCVGKAGTGPQLPHARVSSLRSHHSSASAAASTAVPGRSFHSRVRAAAGSSASTPTPRPDGLLRGFSPRSLESEAERVPSLTPGSSSVA